MEQAIERAERATSHLPMAASLAEAWRQSVEGVVPRKEGSEACVGMARALVRQSSCQETWEVFWRVMWEAWGKGEHELPGLRSLVAREVCLTLAEVPAVALPQHDAWRVWPLVMAAGLAERMEEQSLPFLANLAKEEPIVALLYAQAVPFPVEQSENCRGKVSLQQVKAWVTDWNNILLVVPAGRGTLTRPRL